MKRTATLLVGIIVGAAVWGTALAAIPDSNDIIRACYEKKHGDLRVIDFEAGERCGRNEAGLGWSTGLPRPPKWLTTQVGPDGSAFRSSVDGVTARRGGLGVYFVTFPFSVFNCDQFTSPLEGPNIVQPIAAYRYGGPLEEVMVKVFNADGLPADAGFQLGLICSPAVGG
jgi:hypothetical protein